MEVVSFNKQSLKDFIYSEKYFRLQNIPISKQRAISQINNPRASEEDILLVAQFDENKTVGYLGILPDYIFHEGKQEKIGWLTCFWVDEEYKSKNVAANLFLRVIRAWKQKIFITNIVPRLESVYQKTKIFSPTQFKTGFRGYLRFNLSEILPPKNPVFEKSKPLLKVIDKTLNFFADKRLSVLKIKNIPDLKFEYLVNFNEIPESFFLKFNDKYWSQRGKAELNWIINYPWLIEGATTDVNSKRYYFSSLSQRFFYQVVKVTDSNNNTVALTLVLVRDNSITIPYVWGDSKHFKVIAGFILNTMIDLKVNMITVFNDQLSKAFTHYTTSFVFSKRIKKPYLISKKFGDVEDLNFQDGDGDCAFY